MKKENKKYYKYSFMIETNIPKDRLDESIYSAIMLGNYSKKDGEFFNMKHFNISDEFDMGAIHAFLMESYNLSKEQANIALGIEN